VSGGTALGRQRELGWAALQDLPLASSEPEGTEPHPLVVLQAVKTGPGVTRPSAQRFPASFGKFVLSGNAAGVNPPEPEDI